MAQFRISADFSLGDQVDSAEDPSEPKVLELRVHGVNNTTPAALLDLPLESIELAAGDTLGSFWQPTAATLKAQHDGTYSSTRGRVPDGVIREAYSWGGMVRTTPNVGGPGGAGKIVAVIARIFYAAILPLSIANAVQWTRRLSLVPSGTAAYAAWRKTPEGKNSRRTASAARFFSLVLTLLFTTTVVALALDIGAAQCAAEAPLCGPLQSVFSIFEDWSSGRRLALFALVPIAAVILLWIVSAVSQVRYDVLPGMEGNTITDADEPESRAVLSQTGFWSNRLTRYLARTHLSAAISLTMLFVGLQTSFGWASTCGDSADDCVVDGWPSWTFWAAIAIVVAGAAGLLASAVLVMTLPTMTIQTEEQVESQAPNLWSQRLLVISSIAFAIVLFALAVLPTPEIDVAMRLFGAGVAPLILAIVGAALAVSGFWWRPAKHRTSGTAWSGRGPGVFMTLALTVALGASAIIVVTAGDVLNGAQGPAALIRTVEPEVDLDPTDSEAVEGEESVAGEDAPEGSVSIEWTDQDTGVSGSTTVGAPSIVSGLEISRSYVAMGVLIVAGLLVAVGTILIRAFKTKRSLENRATLWRTAPTSEPPQRGGAKPPAVATEISVPQGGVLPPSPVSLFRRITDKRTTAARLHLMEPSVWVAAVTSVIALLIGIGWVCGSYIAQTDLWFGADGFWQDVVVRILDLGMLSLAGIGLLLVGVLAAGATSGGTRPLGIVWDIVCYLPRTGHPFGPPCYAERAVPEIAGRMHRWLRKDDANRVILSAHSMGAVLAVSALGLLASSTETRERMPRVSLLTFGVQLRPFFGRLLPELLGPDVVGTHSSLPPRFADPDPWNADLEAEKVKPRTALDPTVPGAGAAPATRPPIGRLTGILLPRDAEDRPTIELRWISLWRLTDYLGYPAFSTAPSGADWQNHVDRYASELDLSGYMVEVGTHGEYYRVAEYTEAVEQLRDELIAMPVEPPD